MGAGQEARDGTIGTDWKVGPPSRGHVQDERGGVVEEEEEVETPWEVEGDGGQAGGQWAGRRKRTSAAGAQVAASAVCNLHFKSGVVFTISC